MADSTMLSAQVTPQAPGLPATSRSGSRLSFTEQPAAGSSEGGNSPGADLQANVARALLESNFGDLEELSNDMAGLSVYAIRGDHLQAWANKLRTSLRVMRGAVNGELPDTRPGRRAPASARRDQSKERSDGGTGGADGGEMAGSPGKAGTAAVAGAPPATIAPYASGALHLLLDSLVHITHADWGTCFVYNAKAEDLVLACSAGKRLDRAGSLRLSATSGIESHVLTTGIAVNVAHAYAEEEFHSAQDVNATTRTRSELVLPLLKPGSNTHTFGVMQLCNKRGGTSFFDEADEVRAAECAQFIAAIMAKFSSDLTNPACFDNALLATVPPLPRDVTGGLMKGFALPSDAQNAAGVRLVFRTARAGHVRRSEVMRDAGNVSSLPTISEALGHVAKVHDAWRNAVLLNIELEQEIARLQESLAISKRENGRLQTTTNELKKQLESAAASLEQAKLRRQNSLHLSASTAPSGLHAALQAASTRSP